MPTPPDSFAVISACRTLFQQRFGTLLQEIGLLSGPAIQAILRGAGDYFDEIVVSSRRGSFREEFGGLTASHLTLMDEDDLELEIRLDNLSARLFQETGGDLWKIHLRFVTLLKRTDLSKNHNPVGPNAIIRGLEEMFEAADAISLDKKLEMLDRIETGLQKNLPVVYAEINNFLADQGAEAAPPNIVSSTDHVRPEAVASATANSSVTATDNALLALKQALFSQLPPVAPPKGKTASGAVGALVSQAALERLNFRLDELDRLGGFVPATNSPRLETLIPGLFSEENASPPQRPKSLSAAELGIPATAPEGLAIDTLAMIFGSILDNPKLPDALKSIISSLQIIILKLALRDAVFFTDAAHPARLLLDRMGVATFGLPLDVSARHPICKRLFEIAGQLRSGFKGDVAAFNAALTQVDALIAARTTDLANGAKPYIPLLEQLDQRDQAAIEAGLALDKLIQRGVPAPVREFIDNTWRRVLQLVLSEHGQHSSQWQANNKVIEELLWSFEPKAAAEDRQALAKRLPEILKLLKAGMERVGMSAEAQAAFFDTSFSLQTQALRTGQGGGVADSVGSIEAKPSDAIETGFLQRSLGRPVAGELRAGNWRLSTLDFASSQPAVGRTLPCELGDWLEIRLADGKTCVAYLSYLSPTTRRALFYNPDLGLALAMHPAILEKQFQEGVARVCSSTSLFGAAADRALRRTTKV